MILFILGIITRLGFYSCTYHKNLRWKGENLRAEMFEGKHSKQGLRNAVMDTMFVCVYRIFREAKSRVWKKIVAYK